MELLISKGVEVESRSDADTPLIWAAGHDQPESVKLLLKHNTDISMPLTKQEATLNCTSVNKLADACVRTSAELLLKELLCAAPCNYEEHRQLLCQHDFSPAAPPLRLC